MSFSIRSAARADVGGVIALSDEFASYLRSLGDPSKFSFDAEAYLRDGFGPSPAFSGLVAEAQGQILGYLLYHEGYEVDNAIRLLHVIDLYVRSDARRQGIGRALMQEAARVCRELGGEQLFWAIYKPNQLAFAFYEALGASYVEDLSFMRLGVDALEPQRRTAEASHP
ncbi:MAG: GNAT family N-acetyltransferase [Myxococcales bacterium]|nr:GNAT family N-acetyltransferase [Myxococcales bacterium]MDH5566661.1 GNAT family N-acetyltransferase [Myxococcales bacterium]